MMVCFYCIAMNVNAAHPLRMERYIPHDTLSKITYTEEAIPGERGISQVSEFLLDHQMDDVAVVDMRGSALPWWARTIYKGTALCEHHALMERFNDAT